jgi:hypothetical protein
VLISGGDGFHPGRFDFVACANIRLIMLARAITPSTRLNTAVLAVMVARVGRQLAISPHSPP